MVKRMFVAVLAAVASLAVVAGPASAAPPDTRFTFAGESASTVVSDCGTDPAPGTRCTVIFVFGSEEKVNEDGLRTRSETLSVDVFDVLVTGPNPQDVVPIAFLGSGFTTDADVRITGGLRRGFASADDLVVGGYGTIDIEVTWVGVGSISRFRVHEKSDFEGTNVRFSENSRFREADVTAVIDGETFTEFDLFGSSLNKTKFGSVCRGDCDFGPF
jgi:hypothetical protein